MTLSSALARSTRAIGSSIGLVVVGVVVLVSALCHLGQILPGGSEHDAPLSHSSVTIDASEAWDTPAVDSESDGHGEHSCHERTTAASPPAPAVPVVAKPAVFGDPTPPTAAILLPLVTDQPHPAGPRPYTLCVLRT
jgi:hypothetical protein